MKTHKFFALIGLALLVAALAACGSPAPAAPTAVTVVQAQPPAAPTTAPVAGMPNPASVFCQQQGGKTDIRKDATGGEVGYCVFPDKSECEEWAFQRGECKPGAQPTAAPGIGMANPASVFCVQQGGKSEIRKNATGGEVGYCVFPDKSECEEWAFQRGECKPGAQPTTALRLTKADAGKKVDFAPGGTLELALEGNPTTGYTWKVMSGNDAVLKQMGDSTFTPQSNLMGAPGVEVFKFQAVGAGSVTLKLGYKQWWDNAMQPNPTFEVTVNVGGGASAPTLQVAAKDNGKSFDLVKGGTVVVTLEGNPGSTGYLWGLESANDAVLKPAGDYKFTSTSNMPGAGGKFEFKFTAASAGTATLKFANKQPWNLNDPQAQTFSVTINVK